MSNEPTTSTARVAAMRATRAEAGIKRVDVYAHKDDVPQIRALAKKLQQRRIKNKARKDAAE